MIVILHVIVALAGIASATHAYFKPTVTRLNATYGLIAGTIISGVYLVVLSPSQMIHTCLVGVGYLLAVGAVALAARHKLKLMAIEDRY